MEMSKQRVVVAVESYRDSDPGLHYLYVRSAIKHLIAIDQVIQRLWDFSNMNLLDSCDALMKERKHLLDTKAAYAEADEWLKEIRAEQQKGIVIPLVDADEEID